MENRNTQQTKRIFIEITIPVGVLCIADIANNGTIIELKERIHFTLAYPVHLQRLHYRGAVLRDNKTFQEYPGIMERSRLRLSMLKEEDLLENCVGLVLGTKLRPYKQNPYYLPRAYHTKYVDLRSIHTFVYIPLGDPNKLYAPDVIELIQNFLKNAHRRKQQRQ